jgi:hypothetical protein
MGTGAGKGPLAIVDEQTKRYRQAAVSGRQQCLLQDHDLRIVLAAEGVMDQNRDRTVQPAFLRHEEVRIEQQSGVSDLHLCRRRRDGDECQPQGN